MDAEAVVTFATVVFGGYHLARAAWARVAGWMPADDYDDEPAAAIAPPDYAAYIEDNPDAPLRADEWSRLMNDEPNVIPHLAAYGPSGSGKSTLILALLKRRPGQIAITTIKNEIDDPWGGFPAVRLGFTTDEDGEIRPDWTNIRAAIETVYREVMARHADSSRPRTPLTLVVDELTTTINALDKPVMVQRFIDMWLTARSVGVRLVVMDPTANVDGWGLSGRGDVRDSIGFVRCERDKSAMIGELDECRRGDGVWLDTSQVPALAAGALDATRVWVPQRGASAAPAAPTPSLNIVNELREYLDDHPGASQRELEEALFGYTGGDAYKQVKKALLLLRRGRATA